VLSGLRRDAKTIYTNDIPASIKNFSSKIQGLEYTDGAMRLREMINGKSFDGDTDALSDFLNEVLKKHSGNKSAAARELHITRTTLYRYLKKFDLSVS
jgi:transcriptional regulator of acetoin/glycerol metabolism